MRPAQSLPVVPRQGFRIDTYRDTKANFSVPVLAAAISRNGPLALIASKEIARGGQDWTLAEGWRRQAEITAPVFTSKDAREGATAFAQKRDPVWRGV